MPVKPRRLGFGEFEPELLQGEHEHWISGYTACFRFLEAVRERYRAVLDDLATFPLERVPELAREGDAIQWVRDWAKRQGRGLKCDLIVRVAAWTLDEWARNPEARAARLWALDRVTWYVPPTQLSNIFPDPFTEARASWKKRCDQLWQERVRELEAAGASRTEFKDPQHYDWLAQYVVGKRSFGQIQLKADHIISRQAVADAVHRLAEKIQLSLPVDSKASQGKKRRSRRS